MTSVLIIGDPAGGFSCIGPFSTPAAATAAARELSGTWWVSELRPVEVHHEGDDCQSISVDVSVWVRQESGKHRRTVSQHLKTDDVFHVIYSRTGPYWQRVTLAPVLWTDDVGDEWVHLTAEAA